MIAEVKTMQRLKINEADIIKIGVQQEIQRSAESRYNHRLHGILMICNGYSCYEVAEVFGHSPRTVESWVKRFEESGFAGLEEEERPGRPSVIHDKTRKALEKDLRRSPRDFGYSQNLWDGKLLSHHLAQKYNVSLKVRQCQRLFHQFGFRLRKPRPVIAHIVPQEQEAYKKTQASRQKR
jgi:transposase